MRGQDEWWRDQIPEDEKVLWFGQPDQGYFPPRIAWFYKPLFVLLVLVWAISPWIVDSAGDFWKIAFWTLLLVFFLWLDRYVRARQVYVLTSQNAWQINQLGKPKSLKIDPFLRFHHKRKRVVFARHPFFSFNHLSNPDAALKALHQAQEAMK